jgi:hypothetical protein
VPPEYDSLGILVHRNGDVTLRSAATGNPGVPTEALDFAETDVLFKLCQLNPAQNEEDEEVDEWRNVIYDTTTGKFVRFADDVEPSARDVIEHELHH